MGKVMFDWNFAKVTLQLGLMKKPINLEVVNISPFVKTYVN